MYTLRVVASERRLSQVSVPTVASNESMQRGMASRSPELLNGDSDSFTDDSEGELLGLDDDSQAIEFTAGNPRVEHITGVVHLYRPTPGRLQQTTATPAASSMAAPASTQVKQLPAGGPGASALPALINAPPPVKSIASWASLLGAPAPPPTQQAATGAAVGSLGCDELCCLALPSDMTIADFCSFLGAHLLRLRRMRVLRRQVGPASNVAAARAASASTMTAAAAAAAGPPLVRSSAGASTSRPASGGGSAVGADAAGRQPSQERQQAAAAVAAGVAEAALTTVQDGEDPPPTLTLRADGTADGVDRAAQPPTQSSASGGAAHNAPSAPAQPSPQPLRTPQRHQPQPQAQTGVNAAPARPPLYGSRPPPQRVVCMVLMRMMSPEAADELYNDLNGKPFSSLEPDIVCRLVRVRHVEVTGGGGKHSAVAATAEEGGGDGGGGGSSCGGGPAAAAEPDAAAAAALQTAAAPPPGQTELPTCPVCLERLDEHVSGIVTTVCNHMFHSECLQKWADSTCPVCRYCVQGAANTSRCGLCATAVDLWICLICGHVGCGRYRAGHAADHWRTSGHCYALELETQRVWDYVGDNYVHRLIQSKTDGKLVELAAPATAVTSPHSAGRGGGGGAGGNRHGHYHHHHHHHSQDSDGQVSCGGAAAGAGGGGYGESGGSGRCGGSGGSGGQDDGGWPGWSTADDQLKEALMASKLDAIAVEYNHLLASQLDSQRQYYEGLVAQATLDADHRCAQAGAAADKAIAEAEAAQATAREETRKRSAAERKAAETSEALRSVRQEAEFLRSLNETLLANQRDFKQQLAAEKGRADTAEATVRELQEQVRDLAFFIEAQRTISEVGGGELRQGTVLPLLQGHSSRSGGRGGASNSSSRAGARAGAGGSGNRGGSGSGK